MSDMTAGQAACIAWNEHYATEHGIEARNEWAASDPRGRDAWEAAAKAAQEPLTARLAAITALLDASHKRDWDSGLPGERKRVADERAGLGMGALE